MITPDQIIADKRQRIAAKEAELEVERAELRGMEMMAQLIVPSEAFKHLALASLKVGKVVSRTSSNSFSEAVSKGRQPGSISMRWRAALWRLDAMGGNFSPTDIVDVVRELEGREMRPADAKRQMESYTQLGFVSVQGDAYNITEEFRSKFAESADGSHGNGEAAAEPDGPDGGVGTSPAPDFDL